MLATHIHKVHYLFQKQHLINTYCAENGTNYFTGSPAGDVFLYIFCTTILITGFLLIDISMNYFFKGSFKF